MFIIDVLALSVRKLKQIFKDRAEGRKGGFRIQWIDCMGQILGRKGKNARNEEIGKG